MNQADAFRATIRIAEQSGMPELPGSDLGLHHLRSMLEVVNSKEFSEGKLGRWLGWAQCALVAANVGVTLDDMKALNARHLDRSTPVLHCPICARKNCYHTGYGLS